MKTKTLTSEQIRRIELVVEKLALENPVAESWHKNLKGKTESEKRNFIAGAYGLTFALLTGVNMAMDSKKSTAEIEKAFSK